MRARVWWKRQPVRVPGIGRRRGRGIRPLDLRRNLALADVADRGRRTRAGRGQFGLGTSRLESRDDNAQSRVAGGASFQNVDARNVGAVGINSCGSFHFTPAGSEFGVTDLGLTDGGGTTGP
mgnify:CR=1 FL=1